MYNGYRKYIFSLELCCNMKKIIKYTLIIGLIVAFVCGCNVRKIDENENADAKRFKEEYESLNGEKMDITIPENNKMKYASFDEIMNLLDQGTGVIYFGFPECPWCRNIVPVLINSAMDTDVEEILYFNALSMRDQKHLDENGNIVTDQEGTDEYYRLLEKLSSTLGPYEGLNDETIKRLYFPTVVFVKDGKIVASHIGSVDSQKDPSIKLTKAQTDELYQIYTESIQKMLGLICDDGKVC